MSRKRVISAKNLPTRLPTLTTAVVWLLLDRLGIVGVWAGVAYTVLGFLWVAAIVTLIIERQVDILPDEKRP